MTEGLEQRASKKVTGIGHYPFGGRKARKDTCQLKMTALICAPMSLVMTPTCCHYCGRSGGGHYTVHALYGILACDAHISAAKRDIDAHLHQENMVRMEDARVAAPDFFAALPPTFAVKRSSGAMDDGWTLPNEDHDRVYVRRRGDEWLLNVEKKSEEIAKGVPLTAFIGLPGITADVIAILITALEGGFYKAAAEEHEALKAQGAKFGPTFNEHRDIQHAYVSKNGGEPMACRLFVPS